MGAPAALRPDGIDAGPVAEVAVAPPVRWRSGRTALFLGTRSITRGNLGVLALTVAMMALVYAQLLFIPALIQGAIEGIEGELRSTVTGDLVVTPTGEDLVLEDAAGVTDALRSVPGVEAATAAMLAGNQVSSGTRTNSWPVLAVDPDGYGRVFATPEHLVEGRFLEPGDRDRVVLGIGIAGADREGLQASLRSVHAGDVVTLTLVDGSRHEYEVVGIYEDELVQANARAFVTAGDATAKVPALAGRATSVAVRADGTDVATVAAAVADRVDGVRVDTWEELGGSLDEQVASFRLIGRILGGVSLFVAAITVFIVTYVDLAAKRRTIGIERAIGITPRAVVGSYALRAVVFGLSGVSLGAALVLLGVVPFFERHPLSFPTGPVSLSVTGEVLRRNAAVMLAVAVVGALLPAWRAVRTRLFDAIWG
ncbi:MAG: FtsX-like permease family protein [Acidimicrobiales bacterium]|nr:FtsX-like permease family protein [Acidimicrobiales bacterium]MCB9371490.1 FtsX-like permease family protein [Microthrixaceae bacterium]